MVVFVLSHVVDIEMAGLKAAVFRLGVGGDGFGEQIVGNDGGGSSGIENAFLIGRKVEVGGTLGGNLLHGRGEEGELFGFPQHNVFFPLRENDGEAGSDIGQCIKIIHGGDVEQVISFTARFGLRVDEDLLGIG